MKPGPDRKVPVVSRPIGRTAVDGDGGNTETMSVAARGQQIARRTFASWSGRLNDLLFPPRCALCDAELAVSQHPLLCTTCQSRLLPTAPSRCPRCALESRQALVTEEGCPHCVGEGFHFRRAWAIGDYAGDLRDAVLRMKHAREEPLAAAMAELLCDRIGGELSAWRPDLVAPVPMHWLRYWFRGTNSAATLADILARRLGTKAASGLTRRRRFTRPQSGLSPPQRLANVRGAFRVRRRRTLAGKSVLLVDDILTTAATTNEIARLLLRAGAREVGVVVVARADDR
ncbi:MAG TPA: ComF family protein [Pirellulales bacterium]|nr:ComF family protein [Pirellulales bacterium]